MGRSANSRTDTWRLVQILLILGVIAGTGTGFSGPEVEVDYQARALQPGEVVLFTVGSERSLESVEIVAFDRSFPLVASSADGRWVGLVGIDLSVAPGVHPVRINAHGAVSAEETVQLEVLDKEFPVRRLTVDEKYVSPPAEVIERIQRESKLVSAIFEKRTEEKYWEGSFVQPVPGPPSSAFGKRSILNGKPRSPHSGTDFRASKGTPIQAPNDGVVVLARDLYYAGNTVILDHGMGLYSYLAHLSEFKSREGDRVSRGDVVGLVGSTGRVTGPHLHWTVRLAGARVDPLSLMDVTRKLAD